MLIPVVSNPAFTHDTHFVLSLTFTSNATTLLTRTQDPAVPSAR